MCHTYSFCVFLPKKCFPVNSVVRSRVTVSDRTSSVYQKRASHQCYMNFLHLSRPKKVYEFPWKEQKKIEACCIDQKDGPDEPCASIKQCYMMKQRLRSSVLSRTVRCYGRYSVGSNVVCYTP